MAVDETVSEDRRNYARVQLAKLAVVEQPDAPSTPAVVVDVSERGVRLKMPQPPTENTQYLLHFRLHGASYSARFAVVRSESEQGYHHWGCVFKDVPAGQLATLRRTVYKLFGRAHVRPWQDIKHDCSLQPNERILVGCTAGGKEVYIASRDCLHLGAKGVRQFVHDVEDAASVSDVVVSPEEGAVTDTLLEAVP